MRQLSSLKKKFKVFSTELIEDGNLDKPSYLQHSPKIFSEAAWVQLGFLINFGSMILQLILRRQIKQ
jgi:hypothetical protein